MDHKGAKKPSNEIFLIERSAWKITYTKQLIKALSWVFLCKYKFLFIGRNFSTREIQCLPHRPSICNVLVHLQILNGFLNRDGPRNSQFLHLYDVTYWRTLWRKVRGKWTVQVNTARVTNSPSEKSGVGMPSDGWEESHRAHLYKHTSSHF